MNIRLRINYQWHWVELLNCKQPIGTGSLSKSLSLVWRHRCSTFIRLTWWPFANRNSQATTTAPKAVKHSSVIITFYYITWATEGHYDAFCRTYHQILVAPEIDADLHATGTPWQSPVAPSVEWCPTSVLCLDHWRDSIASQPRQMLFCIDKSKHKNNALLTKKSF